MDIEITRTTDLQQEFWRFTLTLHLGPQPTLCIREYERLERASKRHKFRTTFHSQRNGITGTLWRLACRAPMTQIRGATRNGTYEHPPLPQDVIDEAMAKITPRWEGETDA